jgi:hypothetical protein
MTKLRESAEFSEKFPYAIPETSYDESFGGVEQGIRDGYSLTSLSGRGRERAEKKMKKAIELARRVTGEEVNEDPSNFRFTFDGDVRGWHSVAPRPKGYYLPVKMVREIGAGANSRAFEVEIAEEKYANFRIAKILRAYSDRRFPSKAPPQVLEALVKRASEVAEGVAKDEAFRARFGEIIPKTMAVAPGVLLQEMAKGATFDQLPLEKQALAANEVKEAVAMAQKLFPKVLFSNRKKNFLYDRETGKISSWYDMIADGKRSYEKARLSERY